MTTSAAALLSSRALESERYYGAGNLHFITCSGYRRMSFLGSPRRRTLFLDLLEPTRPRYGFVVVGYVVMPEHFHLLLSEHQKGTPSTVMQVLKQGFAQRVLRAQRRSRSGSPALLSEREAQHIWQARFYDFNVWIKSKRIAKLVMPEVSLLRDENHRAFWR